VEVLPITPSWLIWDLPSSVTAEGEFFSFCNSRLAFTNICSGTGAGAVSARADDPKAAHASTTPKLGQRTQRPINARIHNP
jgi:hypothetical protein